MRSRRPTPATSRLCPIRPRRRWRRRSRAWTAGAANIVHATGEDWLALLGGEGDGPFAARVDRHLRAIALDHLIDGLADWAECDVPEWRDEVRRRKEEHHRYLDWYLGRWG